MKSVQLYPTIPMSRYGENLFSQTLYRIVFSDSRTDLIGGKWPDGVCEYREVPRYPAVRGKWILEKWLSAEEYAGPRFKYEMAQWDVESGLMTTGPYPHRGEYIMCHVFVTTPTEASVGWAVYNIERSRGLTPGQKKQGIMEPLEKQQKDQDRRFDDIWGEAMGPFVKADAAVSFGPNHGRAGFKRGADMPVEKWAQSVLPTQDNFFGQIRKQETINTLTGENNGSANTQRS